MISMFVIETVYLQLKISELFLKSITLSYKGEKNCGSNFCSIKYYEDVPYIIQWYAVIM